MKTNLRKITGIVAVVVFLVALAINVKVTIDDPFTMVNEEALAQETTTGTAVVSCSDSSTTGGTLYDTRKCDGCTKEWFNVPPGGQCSFSYIN